MLFLCAAPIRKHNGAVPMPQHLSQQDAAAHFAYEAILPFYLLLGKTNHRIDILIERQNEHFMLVYIICYFINYTQLS